MGVGNGFVWYELMTSDLPAARRFYAEVMHGPVEVPGGGRIVQPRDPQGALFALTGPRA